MPKDNFLISHWHSETESFLRTLHNPDVDDSDQIHQIRVSIKKLRAYLNLYFLLSQNRGLKFLFKETDYLFNVLGKHRNIDITQQQAAGDINSNIPLLSSYLKWLQLSKNQLPSVADILTQYEAANLASLTGVIKDHLGYLDNVKLGRKTFRSNSFFLKKIRVNMRHFRHNFHEIRKDLKSIYYTSVISPETGLSKSQIKMLNKALDLLGNTRDEEVSLQFLHQYVYSNLNYPCDVLNIAARRIKKRKLEMLKKARCRVRKFLKVVN